MTVIASVRHFIDRSIGDVKLGLRVLGKSSGYARVSSSSAFIRLFHEERQI